MKSAVQEYLAVTNSPDSWIVDRFVISASRLGELVGELKGKTTEPVPVSVVASPLEGDPGARVRHDVIEVQEARARGLIRLEAFEARIPAGSTPSVMSAVRKFPSQLGEPDLDLFLEVGWNDDMVDLMHDAAAAIEDVGFKGRTGGTTSEAFPSTSQLAEFISECAALEAPFKFTAGLHDPVRHWDETIGVSRHGFLNVLCASALAVSADLSRREIQEILEIEDPTKFHFGADDVRVGEHWLESGGIDQFLELFSGFGSCSVQEPLDGLRALGLLEGVGA